MENNKPMKKSVIPRNGAVKKDISLVPQKKKVPKSVAKKVFPLKNKMALGLVGTVIIFLGITYLTYQNLTTIEKNASITKHTVEVLEHLSHILSDLSDAETGQRGYLLTGGLKYLEPYNSGISSVGEEINEVEQLTVDNPAQQERIVLLKDLVKQKENELRETVSLKSEGKSEEAIAIVLSDRGKDIMDNIRFLILDMQEEEERLLEVREKELNSTQIKAKTVLLFGSLIGFFFALFISFFIVQKNRDPYEPA